MNRVGVKLNQKNWVGFIMKSWFESSQKGGSVQKIKCQWQHSRWWSGDFPGGVCEMSMVLAVILTLEYMIMADM